MKARSAILNSSLFRVVLIGNSQLSDLLEGRESFIWISLKPCPLTLQVASHGRMVQCITNLKKEVSQTIIWKHCWTASFANSSAKCLKCSHKCTSTLPRPIGLCHPQNTMWLVFIINKLQEAYPCIFSISGKVICGKQSATF